MENIENAGLTEGIESIVNADSSGGMETKEISQAVINRLPRYYRYLNELMNKRVERISSNELSELMNTTASSIRQDLNNFGGFGQQGYGYNVKNLRDEIAKILGMDSSYNVIIIGTGRLGQALANFSGLKNGCFNLIGLFDIKSDLVGEQVDGIIIRDISEIDDFIKDNNVDIVAVTTPKSANDIVSGIIRRNSIKAVWNFSNTELALDKDVIVEDVHLTDSLIKLSYRIKWKD